MIARKMMYTAAARKAERITGIVEILRRRRRKTEVLIRRMKAKIAYETHLWTLLLLRCANSGSLCYRGTILLLDKWKS